MKKEFKKLTLNKRTILNLGTPEMTKIVGGRRTVYCFTDFRCTQGCGGGGGGQTQNGRTCPGHNTCDVC